MNILLVVDYGNDRPQSGNLEVDSRTLDCGVDVHDRLNSGQTFSKTCREGRGSEVNEI